MHIIHLMPPVAQTNARDRPTGTLRLGHTVATLFSIPIDREKNLMRAV